MEPARMAPFPDRPADRHPGIAIVMTLVGLIVWMAFRIGDSVKASLNTGSIIGLIIFVLLIIAFPYSCGL